MPTIPLTNALGLEEEFVSGRRITDFLPDFIHLKDTSLDSVPVEQLRAGLSFARPVSVPFANLSLEVGGSGKGTMALMGPRDLALDPEDALGAIEIKANEMVLALGLDFSMSSDVALDSGPGTFGISANRGFTVHCYRRFENGSKGFASFGKAFTETASCFFLPQDLHDLRNLQADTVILLEGNGALSVSAAFNIETPVQSLSANAVEQIAPLEVSGSFGAEVNVTIAGGYRIRLRRVEGSIVEIGVYDIDSREVGVIFEAGVSASTDGKSSLAKHFVSALANHSPLSLDEFRQTDGVDPREQELGEFEDTLEEAVSAKLQIAASAAISRLRSNEAAWLFEIDLDAATSAEAAACLKSALRGDFTALTTKEALPAGIRQTANVLTRTEVKNQTLQVNLLGMLNFVSVHEITRISAIERNVSDEITLVTDTSSMSRVEALLSNTGGDARRLRRMLSENFLVEAAYHAANVGVLPPDFRSRHVYIELHDRTSKAEMKDNLDVARVLGLISPEEQARRLGGKRNFGRTTFYVEASYSNDGVRQIFLDASGVPRTVQEYEDIGRSALGALLTGDDGHEFRQRYADLGLSGTTLWLEMKRVGNAASFGPLFGRPVSGTDPRLGAVASDFVMVTSWASAMNGAARAVQEVDELLSGDTIRADDKQLVKAREMLNKRITNAIKHSHDQFGDPLGLIMVYIASGQNAAKRVVASGSEIEPLDVSFLPALSAGARTT